MECKEFEMYSLLNRWAALGTEKLCLTFYLLMRYLVFRSQKTGAMCDAALSLLGMQGWCFRFLPFRACFTTWLISVERGSED